MTVVRIKWTGDPLEVSVSGHAGYGPKGSDIVCAAVSMLSQSLAAALEQAEKDGLLGCFHYQAEDGGVEIQAAIHSHGRKIVDGMVRVTIAGFRLLEERYPGHVSVHTDNRPP